VILRVDGENESPRSRSKELKSADTAHFSRASNAGPARGRSVYAYLP
jgi:hypothetical protein